MRVLILLLLLTTAAAADCKQIPDSGNKIEGKSLWVCPIPAPPLPPAKCSLIEGVLICNQNLVDPPKNCGYRSGKYVCAD